MSDPLTPDQRSYCMSQVKSKDTGPEVLVRSALHRRGLRFRKHLKTLPGRPDIVFTRAKIAIFIDGDFWHGYDFDAWKDDLSPFWHKKIAANIERDHHNFRNLNTMGWRVLRVWDHDIKADLDDVVQKIHDAVDQNRNCKFDVSTSV